MANFYSQYYALTPGSSTSYQPRTSPQNTRPGEIIVIRAQVALTAAAVSTDVCYLAPVVSGLRPVFGQIDATATNGTLTGNLGWTSSAAAIAALTTQLQSNTATLLTPAQIKAITALSADGDNLLLTLTGNGGTATTITVLLGLVNCGS
jgi:hypothetical protein